MPGKTAAVLVPLVHPRPIILVQVLLSEESNDIINPGIVLTGDGGPDGGTLMALLASLRGGKVLRGNIYNAVVRQERRHGRRPRRSGGACCWHGKDEELPSTQAALSTQ